LKTELCIESIETKRLKRRNKRGGHALFSVVFFLLPMASSSAKQQQLGSDGPRRRRCMGRLLRGGVTCQSASTRPSIHQAKRNRQWASPLSGKVDCCVARRSKRCPVLLVHVWPAADFTFYCVRLCVMTRREEEGCASNKGGIHAPSCLSFCARAPITSIRFHYTHFPSITTTRTKQGGSSGGRAWAAPSRLLVALCVYRPLARPDDDDARARARAAVQPCGPSSSSPD
jgi:hypothetical protein